MAAENESPVIDSAAGDVSSDESLPQAEAAAPVRNDLAGRETLESIIVAIILAFLFRGFVAEAFVIPTGSMAPTLQGRHMDIVCPECGYQYRTGASVENDELGPPRGEVTSTRCPICRVATKLDKQNNPNHRSFNGDRILVSKFAYQIQEPRRWDVIVFKYPGEAKVNFIKRLIGLPGETIRIRHGDIYTLDPDSADLPPSQRRFTIARKPADKVLALLQLVDDTEYQTRKYQLWRNRWSNVRTRSGASKAGGQWQPNPQGYSVDAADKPSWLGYRHFIPRADDLFRVENNESLNADDPYKGQLITDYYAYNDSYSQMYSTDTGGECWVGDLAVECEVEVIRPAGELLLELVEGGTFYQCSVDLATGRARLGVHGAEQPFVGPDGRQYESPVASTSLQGTGKHRVRFANVDDQLFLWIDDKLVEFETPTTFRSRENVTPQWSSSDPGDLSPARIGARDTQLQVTRLRVLRDVYYRAVEPVEPYRHSEYDRRQIGYEFDVARVMSDPHQWATTPLFDARRSVTFTLEDDQYFPLGDNSPESRDARVWSERLGGSDHLFPPPYVKRELLIGKAIMIYWPHSWRAGVAWLPIVPNFQRMGRIR